MSSILVRSDSLLSLYPPRTSDRGAESQSSPATWAGQNEADPAPQTPTGLSSESPPVLSDSGYSDEQAADDADAIFRAVEPGAFGWGTEEDPIFEILERLNTFEGAEAQLTDAQQDTLVSQRVERLAQVYKDHYEKDGESRDLRANLKEELDDTPDDWIRAQALLDGDVIGARAAYLHMTLDRHEDDEFMAMLQQTPGEDRAALAQAYARHYLPEVDADDSQAARDALLSAMANSARPTGRGDTSRKTFSDEQMQEARALFDDGDDADRTIAEAAAERAHGHIDDGVIFGWGSGVDMDGLRETIDALSPEQREVFASVYEERYGDRLEDDVADIGNDDQGREIELLLSAVDTDDPKAASDNQTELTISRLRQDADDADALREQLEPMSAEEIGALVASDPSLRDDLLAEHDGDDRDEIGLLLEKPDRQSPERAAWQAEYDAIRIHRALDGLNDEDLLRTILRPKTLPEIQAMTAVYEERYAEELSGGDGTLRGRLVSELGARDEREIIEQMFDLGAIDLANPRDAIAERIRRVRELQAFEGDSDFTSFAQRLGRWDWDYETDPERLERNLSAAEDALRESESNPEKLAEAARLAGFSEADIETLVQTKDSAATYAATGGAIVLSTGAIIVTGGSATPLVVAGWSAAAGAVGAGGTYALVNHQAGGSEIARETLIGAVGGATVLPVTRGGLVALETGGLQAIRANTTIGVANGASTGFTAAATDSHTWENGWQEGTQIVLVNTAVGGGAGAVLAPAVTVTAQGIRALHRSGTDGAGPTLPPDGVPADPTPAPAAGETTPVRVDIVDELADGQTGTPVVNEAGEFLGYAVEVPDPPVQTDTLAIEGAVPNAPPQPASSGSGQTGAGTPDTAGVDTAASSSNPSTVQPDEPGLTNPSGDTTASGEPRRAVAAGVDSSADDATIQANIAALLRQGPDLSPPSPRSLSRAQAAFRAGTASSDDHAVLLRQAVLDSRLVMTASASVMTGNLEKLTLLRGFCGQASGNFVSAFDTLLGRSPFPATVRRYQSGDVFGTNRHAFTTVEFGGNPPARYLVDNSFGQFMSPPSSTTSRVGDVLRETPEGSRFAEALLRDGFVPLTADNARLFARGLGAADAEADALGARLINGENTQLTHTLGGPEDLTIGPIPDDAPPSTVNLDYPADLLEILDDNIGRLQNSGLAGASDTAQRLRDLRARVDGRLNGTASEPSLSSGFQAIDNRWRTTDQPATPRRFDADEMDALPLIEGTGYRMHWDNELEAWLPVRPVEGVAGVAGERAIAVTVRPDGTVRPLWPVRGGATINTRLSAARQQREAAGISEAERMDLLQKANRYFVDGRTEARSIDEHDRTLLATYLNYFNTADDFTAARRALTENGHMREDETLLDLADVIDYLETPPPADMAAFRAEHGITWREYNLQNQIDGISAYSAWTYVYDLELNTTNPGAWLPNDTGSIASTATRPDLEVTRQAYGRLINETDIAFSRTSDGCFARAELIANELRESGLDPVKIWITPSRDQPLKLRHANDRRYSVEAGYHVVTGVKVETPDGVRTMVFDPSFNDGPVDLDTYLRQVSGRYTVSETGFGDVPDGVSGDGYIPNYRLVGITPLEHATRYNALAQQLAARDTTGMSASEAAQARFVLEMKLGELIGRRYVRRD